MSPSSSSSDVVVAVAAVHVRRRHLHIFHHLLELLQQRLRRVLGAALRQVLEPIDHVLQVALAHHLGIGIERPRQLLIIFQLLRQSLHVAGHRLAQLVHQLLDLVVAGAARERLLQRGFGVAQRVLRVGHVAVLDGDRHLPEPRRHVAQFVVGFGAHQLPEDRAQPEIDAGLRREFLRRDGERIERGDDLRPRIGVHRQIAPLFDQRPRQGLDEDALRQAERQRIALADIAALVMGDERHRHFGAGPGMVGEILDGLADAVPGSRLRQHQRKLRRAVERMRRRRRRRAGRGRLILAREGGLGLGDAVIVLEPIGQ